MDEKHFEEWIILKEKLHRNAKVPFFSDGEIWWTAVGENVGVEINGKSQYFSRPVLIMKKINRFCFMGMPITSREKQGSWYIDFIFQGRREIAVLVQTRVLSAARLYKKLGQVLLNDLERIKSQFHAIFR